MMKWKIYILLMLLLLATCFFSGCKETKMQEKPSLEASLAEFQNVLNESDLRGLSLKVYYMNPNILPHLPYSVEDLISSAESQSPQEVVDISNSALANQIDLLKQINSSNFICVSNSVYYMHAKLCFIFETENNEKVLEIVFGGIDREAGIASLFVNGYEVKYNKLFEDLITVFLPNEVRQLFL